MAPQPPRSTTKIIVGQRKTNKSLYMALAGAGLLGVVALSAATTWLLRAPFTPEVAAAEPAIAQTAPETSAVEPASDPDLAAKSSGQSPYVQVMSSAVSKAESAQNITQSAVSSSDWDVITARWQEAIYIIEQIPESDSLYGEAQEEKEAYRLALSYAQQGKPVPNAAATFSEAVNTATEASQLAQQARTAEEWNNVAEKRTFRNRYRWR